MNIIIETGTLELRMYGETHRITIEPDETILMAANRAKLDPPFSCQSGSCSTCRAKLVSGKVVMDVNDVLSDDEVADGYILTCQSHPLTPELTVDYDS
ncbi:MAG: 2Fe-2S iron-sulfur cluster binding domain-containing protein [Candidatus Kapabacteria bacterium]|nr:2Fe-2S iron-sulfur cluster binding domain-containing protein [Candidatus Kapabacteria bacterium]